MQNRIRRWRARPALAGSPLRAAPNPARRAVVRAVHGRQTEARQQGAALHRLALQHPGAALGAWLQLAEGVLAFYADLGDGAPERVQLRRPAT